MAPEKESATNSKIVSMYKTNYSCFYIIVVLKSNTMKKEKWDGRSRPTNDLYKKEFDRIFGKKEKTTSELLMEGYEEEKKMYEEEDGSTQKTN